MITDYSSIALDFVYLERPLLYFVPDYALFRAGITHNYRELHIPLEEAFGPVVETEVALIDALEELAQRDFVPAPVYWERMRKFFPSRNSSHAQALYELLMKE
jgi:CDP-glycerol glycerophosphotransferase (TagB/SpsB family)